MKYILLCLGLTLTAPGLFAQKAPSALHPAPAEEGKFTGKVTETMDAAGYTYAGLQFGNECRCGAAV